jgi:hypothetical protein
LTKKKITMEEIIKQTLTAIPQYLLNFFKLLPSPRRFPLERLPTDSSKTRESLTEALKFILISYALIVILGVLKNDSDNAMKLLGVVAVSTLIQMSLFVFAIFLAWKIVGSKKQFLDYFIIYSYHFGVTFIIIGVFGLISDGFLKASDKELFDNLIKVKTGTLKFNVDWWSNTNYQIAFGILVFGFFLSTIWAAIGWGAYRIMNETKKWRSFGVLCVAGIFSWVAIAISFLITKGITK